jgi:hypothetical protein
MMKKFKNWLKNRFSAADAAPPQALRKTGSFEATVRTPSPKKNVPELTPEFAEVDPHLHSKVESLGPGKNVLIRKRFVREDTGTHETFKILDDSLIDSGEETGLDPYNTGSFDRSKKWDQRFRK